MPPTAAILLIGNEILTGKVEDENARYLVGRLRAAGVDVGRIEVIPDDDADIVERVRALSARFTWVFTSGGVGPTHDDVTMSAVARAFGVTLMRHPELESMLSARVGRGLYERDLRMADVPEGATLVRGAAGADTWPVVVMRNVYVLPGVPSIFRRKFDAIAGLFQGAPLFARAIYLSQPEGAIAGALDEVVAAFPSVSIGSYPRVDAPDFLVKVTFDGRDRGAVDDACQALAAALPAAVVRTE